MTCLLSRLSCNLIPSYRYALRQAEYNIRKSQVVTISLLMSAFLMLTSLKAGATTLSIGGDKDALSDELGHLAGAQTDLGDLPVRTTFNSLT